MARATSPSDSENSGTEASKEKVVKNQAVDEDDDDEEGGEEYEIEKILDAKRGVFADGRIGYFVKWKGYDSNENSWVDEHDIGGAGDLVKEFWKTHPKKGQQLSSAKKKGRQSTAPESVSTTGTKRGRKSIAKEESDDDVDETPSTARASKKAKRGTNNASGARSVSPEIGANLQTMPDNYSHLEIWDPVVKVVDTVERDGEELYVYFTLHDGRQVKEVNENARLRLPQKMIDFYQSNLRWRAAED